MNIIYSGKNVFLVILTFIFLTAPSCQKKTDDDPEPGTTAEAVVSSDKTSYKGYEIGILNVANHTLAENQYELDFGSKKIVAVKNNDNSLTYIIPGNLASGSYTLKAPFAPNTLTIEVTAPETIADPVTYVGDFMGNPDDDISTYLSFSNTSTVPAELTTAKNNLTQAYADFQALSAADQQIVAQFLKANEEFFTEAEALIQDLKTIEADLQAKTLGLTDFSDCSSKTCKAIVSITKIGGVVLLAKSAPILAIGAAIVVGADIALSLITNKKSFTFSVAFAFLEKAFDLAYWAPNYTAEVVFDAADTKIVKGMKLAAGEFEILKEETFTIQPKIEFSSFSNTLNTTNSQLQSAISLIEKAKAFYTNTLGSPAGAFPSYKNKKELKKPSALSEISVKALNNSNVTVTTPSGTVDGFEVTFNTAATTDQDFTLEISYTGEYEKSVKTYASKLLQQRPPSKLEIISGNMQTGTFNTMLTNPLQVKVTDINGVALKDVTVTWTVTSGGGSVSSITSFTNNLGIAETGWTLGSTGNQKVAASVTRTDGKAVTGSPAQFTANNNMLLEYLTNNSSKTWKESTLEEMGCSSDVVSGCNFWADDRVIFSANGTVMFYYGPLIDCSADPNYQCTGPTGSTALTWEFSSDYSKIILSDGTDTFEYTIISLTSTTLILSGGLSYIPE